MMELGELEQHHADFDGRKVQIVVISNDDPKSAQETQAEFPQLVVVADTDQKMAKALEVIHPGAGHHHEDTNAPTTFLVDGTGTVKWLFRPSQVLERLTPNELLAAIDATWPKP
jgi:peroxiredoxin